MQLIHGFGLACGLHECTHWLTDAPTILAQTLSPYLSLHIALPFFRQGYSSLFLFLCFFSVSFGNTSLKTRTRRSLLKENCGASGSRNSAEKRNICNAGNVLESVGVVVV